MADQSPIVSWPLRLVVLAQLCAAPAAAAPAQSQPAQAGATSPASLPSIESVPALDDAKELAEMERALAADAAKQSNPASAPPTTNKADDGSNNAVVRAFQSLNPQISVILDTALAYFSSDEPLMSGAHDPSRTGFNLQQLEMALSAAVDPYFRFDANIVFAEFGVEIEEAFGTTLSLPWNLQVRAGQFLTRFGRINNSHPHSWAFVDQPLVNGKFLGGEGNRGLGAEISLLLPLPWYVELVGSTTDAAGQATARSFYGGTDLGVNSPLDFVFVGAIKQFFPLSDNWSLAWGLSAASGPNSSGRSNRSDLYGTDLYLKYRPITRGSYTTVALQLESMLRRRQVPLNVLQDHGLYAYLFWRFARRWATAARYEYVSGVEDDPLDPNWTQLRQRVSANLTFWPTEFSRLRVQYNYDRPEWRDDYHAVFFAIEFVVGAHGAHRF